MQLIDCVIDWAIVYIILQYRYNTTLSVNNQLPGYPASPILSLFVSPQFSLFKFPNFKLFKIEIFQYISILIISGVRVIVFPAIVGNQLQVGSEFANGFVVLGFEAFGHC